MPTATQPAAVGGTGNGSSTQHQVMPGDLFGTPRYGTQRRFVPDNGNASLAAVPLAASQVNVPTTRLDQLDIVSGWKIACQYTGEWTNTGTGLEISPFYPSNLIQQITVKLQAAYNTYNLTGPLAGIFQLFRPMWGGNQVGVVAPDNFAAIGKSNPTFGAEQTLDFNIDIPVAMKFDEYFNLDAQGNPIGRKYDQWVTPMFMAAQARVVVPTITVAPQLATGDLLGSPVSRPSTDTTSTYSNASLDLQINRDAWFSAQSPAANPPMYPWLYTRDYFTQPTAGQAKVGALIQNTGVSVGQVLSLVVFVWDPQANSGLGAVVPSSDIESIELVTGGTLQNGLWSPQQIKDRNRSMYGWGQGQDSAVPDGVYVLDFAQDERGGYLSNANAINTYVVNGVQVNVSFKSGSVPSSTSSVYVGVEALKLATS